MADPYALEIQQTHSPMAYFMNVENFACLHGCHLPLGSTCYWAVTPSVLLSVWWVIDFINLKPKSQSRAISLECFVCFYMTRFAFLLYLEIICTYTLIWIFALINKWDYSLYVGAFGADYFFHFSFCKPPPSSTPLLLPHTHHNPCYQTSLYLCIYFTHGHIILCKHLYISTYTVPCMDFLDHFLNHRTILYTIFLHLSFSLGNTSGECLQVNWHSSTSFPATSWWRCTMLYFVLSFLLYWTTLWLIALYVRPCVPGLFSQKVRILSQRMWLFNFNQLPDCFPKNIVTILISTSNNESTISPCIHTKMDVIALFSFCRLMGLNLTVTSFSISLTTSEFKCISINLQAIWFCSFARWLFLFWLVSWKGLLYNDLVFFIYVKVFFQIIFVIIWNIYFLI